MHRIPCRNAFKKPAKMKWWHGTGSLLDYTNPAAVTWWHEQVGGGVEGARSQGL